MEDISAVIIAYNEEKCIARLLNSLKDIEDKVVVYTGHGDKTVEIAKSYGCNVIDVGTKFKKKATKEHLKKWKEMFNWTPHFKIGEGYFHFSEARNYALSFAKNDWCFQPDCDEEVQWDLAKVREIIQNEDQLVYPFVYQHKPDGTPELEFTHCKFFRKSKFRWTKWVHEIEERLPGVETKPARFVDKNIIYHHHWQNQETTRSNYMSGLELSIVERPEDERNMFYLAREYMYYGEYEHSIEIFKKAIAIIKWKPELSEAYRFMGECYKQLGKKDLAISSFYKAIEINDSRREPFYDLARYLDELGEVERSVIYYQAALAVSFKTQGYLNSMELYGWNIYDKLAFNYNRIGNEELSKEYWLKAMKLYPDKRVHSNMNWYYRSDLPLISIVVPVARSEGYNKLVKSIKDTTTYPNIEYLPVYDDLPIPNAVSRFNLGVERAKGELILYVGDDCELQTGCIEQAYTCFKEKFRGKGLVILNDGVWQGKLANHFLCSKNLTEDLGGNIWYEGYHHVGVDNELLGRLKKMNLVEYCEQAKIIHHHSEVPTPGTGKGIKDQYSESIIPYIEQDRKLLYKRQRELKFGPKIVAFCTCYNESRIIGEYVRENLKYVDEVCISDNGSKDDTVEIAKKNGARVILSPYEFSTEHYEETPAKQYALDFALSFKPDWLIYLDADEILESRAKDMLPEMVNNLNVDAYRMSIPTFWLNREDVRIDGDFGYYVNKPYPFKMWRVETGVRMAIVPGGSHSYPYPTPIKCVDSELRVKHYGYETRELALEKYNRYRTVDKDGVMSVNVKNYGHLHPDYTGVKLIKWVD